MAEGGEDDPEIWPPVWLIWLWAVGSPLFAIWTVLQLIWFEGAVSDPLTWIFAAMAVVWAVGAVDGARRRRRPAAGGDQPGPVSR